MWFDVDDHLHNSPELLSIPRRYRAAAMGVWTVCGSWTSAQLTNGFIPNEVIKDYGGTPDIRGWLIKAGFWIDGIEGVQYTSQGCRIPSAQRVRDERVAGARRVRKHRANKQKDPPPADLPRCNGVTPPLVTCYPGKGTSGGASSPPEVGKGVVAAEAATTDVNSNFLANSHSSQDQLLPESGTSPARARGTRLPEGWEPPETVKADLRAKYPNVKLGMVLEEFRDYWQAESGQRARKVDWSKTFRNRVRAVEHEARFQRNGHTLSRTDEKTLGWLAMGRQPEPLRGLPQ
jgi:hypothetical protein